MAHKSEHLAAAMKALPRTGIASIDEETLLLFSCLSRLEVSLSSALAEKRKKATQTIAGARGERIDVTNRMACGRDVDAIQSAAEDDSVEAFVFRSDASVASAALVRLAQHAAMSLKDIERMSATLSSLQESLAKKDQELAFLKEEVASLRAHLHKHDDPEQLYDVYKSSWKEQHATGQMKAHNAHEAKENALRHFLNKRGLATESATKVSSFQLVYRTAEDLLAKEFRNDDGEIRKLIKMFECPAPLVSENGVGDGKGKKKKSSSKEKDIAAKIALLSHGLPLANERTDEPALKLSVSNAQRGADVDSPRGGSLSGDLSDEEDPADAFHNVAEVDSMLNTAHLTNLISPNPAAVAEATKQASQLITQLRSIDLAKSQKIRLEDFDADSQELTMDLVQRTAAANMKRAKTRATQSVKSASLIVTYFVKSNTRRVAKIDDAGTLMYQLRNVLVEAPTTFASLVVDMATAAGKSDLLTEQAAKIGMETIWQQLVQYEQPVARIFSLEGPLDGVVSLQEPLRREIHVSDLLNSVAIDHADLGESRVAQRERLIKLKFCRNDDETNPLLVVRSLGEKSQSATSEHLVTMKQKPGILSFLSTSYGQSAWMSPIQSGLVRCYASSMIDACKPDSLVMPFQDLRSPFFMTEDLSNQCIIISFPTILVVPSGYSVCSVHPITGGRFPRHWKLEGSLDKQKWILLREHQGDESLSRYNPTFYWELQRPHRGEPYFQHFRLTQLGPNACGTHQFCVSGFEVYGRLLYVEKLKVEPAGALPKMKIAKVSFAAFSAIPPPKGGAEVIKKKK